MLSTHHLLTDDWTHSYSLYSAPVKPRLSTHTFWKNLTRQFVKRELDLQMYLWICFLVICSSNGYPMRLSWVYLQAMGWFLDYIVTWPDIWDTDMKSMEDARDTSNALIPLAAKRDRQDDRVTKTIDLRDTHSYTTWEVAHIVRHARQPAVSSHLRSVDIDAGKNNVVKSFLYICTRGNLNCWPHNPSRLMVKNIVWCVWLTIRYQSLIWGKLYCRLSCTPYSHRYAHVMAKVITLTGMDTVRLLINSNVAYVSSCTELANRFPRQCGIQRMYSNRDVILRGDDKESVQTPTSIELLALRPFTASWPSIRSPLSVYRFRLPSTHWGY
jgi:hypothetical protein